jgi:SAM-dependent methyltransferase
MRPGFLERRNLISATGEHFKPPVYAPGSGWLARFRASVLRFFDLQAGTIWADLAPRLPQVSGTVVDAGCGAQPYRGLFGNQVRYIGIDSEDVRNHFRLETPDTLYYSGTQWPLASETADFVLCTETLEHVLEPAIFLAEMYRCLKPGGRVLLTVPYAARWHFLPYDYWRLTPSALGHLFGAAGFAEVCVYGRGNQLTVACYKAMGFIFSLLAPQPSRVWFEWLCRLVGATGIPCVVLLAVLANLTMRWPATVDFLGFTVTAVKPGGVGS